jgi:hypothetical protein
MGGEITRTGGIAPGHGTAIPKIVLSLFFIFRNAFAILE